MLKISNRIFAAGTLAATLISVNLSASACDKCMEAPKMAAKGATSKGVRTAKVSLKSSGKSAKMKAKTASNAKMSPKVMKTGAAKTASTKNASAPMCPMCEQAALKSKI